MCTVSLRGDEESGRRVLMVNHHQQRRRRAPAVAPACFGAAGRHGCMPVDSVVAGRWAAVDDRGVAPAMLNVNRQAAEGRCEAGAVTLSEGLLVAGPVRCRWGES